MLQVGRAQETAVDHDRSYLQDVLGLRDGETEEQMDEKLYKEARELGVDVDALSMQTQKPLSTRTFSSEAPRRSESIDSRASQSTGLTSNYSELSKEQRKQTSRASLSFRDYDNFLARGRPDGRYSLSFSPPTTPSHSAFSLPLSSPSSSPKRHFRRIRGLSMLRLYRTNSGSSSINGCPHCPQSLLSQRRAVHKLPCGHRLCTEALRDTIMAATANKTGAVPSCCGMPIPGTLVEHAMTQEEQSALLDKLDQWDEAASIALSTTSDVREAGPVNRPGVSNRTGSSDSKVDSMAPQVHRDLEKLQDLPDFNLLQKEHAELLERIVAWTERQRLELKTRHEQLRAEMKAHHEGATEDLLEHHGSAMAEAEDKQVKAEADMRVSHAQEIRDNATALKHMEAYCAGTYSTGEPHNRTVTDQDRAELEKTKRIRDTMDAKHFSAINVLRGEQGRRMKLRAQRQDRELQELRRTQRKEELEFERACTDEVHKNDESVTEKRRKMRARWEVQTTILAKRIAIQPSAEVKERFLSVDWQVDSRSLLQQAAPEIAKAEGAASVESGISTGIAVSGHA